MDNTNKPCDTKGYEIRSGIRLDLLKNPDGRLTPGQVKEYRDQVSNDIEFHQSNPTL